MNKTASEIADEVLAKANLEHARRVIDMVAPLTGGSIGLGLGSMAGHPFIGAGLGAAAGLGLSQLTRLAKPDPENHTALIDKMINSSRGDMLNRAKHPGAGYLVGASMGIPMAAANIASMRHDPGFFRNFIVPVGTGILGGMGGSALVNRMYRED